jgi:hypothetical protein
MEGVCFRGTDGLIHARVKPGFLFSLGTCSALLYDCCPGLAFPEAFSAFILPHGRKLTSKFWCTRSFGRCLICFLLLHFFMEVGRISPGFFDFELSPRGEHGEGGRSSLPLMPSCPGEDRGDTSSDQDIAGSHKNTYLEWARLSFCIHSPPGSRLLMPCVCFIKRCSFFGTIGSWERVLIFSLLRMASRRLEEVRSERCFEFL